MKKFFSFLLLLLAGGCLTVFAQPFEPSDASAIELRLKKLNVLGSVLYLAAHPDDENTAVISYFSQEKLYRTGYLSLTRGDGGQNLIGPGKGPVIGIIRSYELLGARGIDGGEQLFTRAVDFGYSKSPGESLDIWGRDDLLADVIFAIRYFKPDVIITRFPAENAPTHGHHLASTQIALEAFREAGNPTSFPEQLLIVEPWQPRRIYWNDWTPRWRPDEIDFDDYLSLDAGAYNPLLGKSYTELAAKSRTMHKSQGFGASGRHESSPYYFKYLDGDSAATDLFESIETSWQRVPGGKAVAEHITKAIEAFSPSEPWNAVSHLTEAAKALDYVENDYWKRYKKKEIDQVIAECLGLYVSALSDTYAGAVGDTVQTTLQLVNRSPLQLELRGIAYPFNESVDTAAMAERGKLITIEHPLAIPPGTPVTEPFWLREKQSEGLFTIPAMEERVIPEIVENEVTVFLRIDDYKLPVTVPLSWQWVDRVDGELFRRFEVRPAVTVSSPDEVLVFPGGGAKEVNVTVKNHSQSPVKGTVTIAIGDGWKVEPAGVSVSLDDQFAEQIVKFSLTPPADASTGVATLRFTDTGGNEYSDSFISIEHPHIPRLSYFPESKVKLVLLDLKKNDEHIGYIMGSGDKVPEALAQLGYEVTMLTDAMLENGDLSQFDVIIAGIRTFNTNERIVHQAPNLFKFVYKGGTLLTQYSVTYGLKTDELGPYKYELSRGRVTLEDAPVSILNPEHPLLNYPNRISATDFENWVQERGLYFAGEWAPEYETIFAMNDPGEEPLEGSLLFARYGEGVFIYSGISWFRQLPAGVPGAYRLFVNLISSGSYGF